MIETIYICGPETTQEYRKDFASKAFSEEIKLKKDLINLNEDSSITPENFLFVYVIIRNADSEEIKTEWQEFYHKIDSNKKMISYI